MTCSASAPFVFNGGEQLNVKIDGGITQTVSFTSGSKSAEDVATILGVLTGCVVQAVGNQVRITTDSDESGASVQVIGGSANLILSFSTDLIKGFNAFDAEIGRLLETDSEFRLRRAEVLQAAGSRNLDAMRARLLLLDGVIQVLGYENYEDVEVDGRPPHSYEFVVHGGNDDEIAQTLFEFGSEGIEAFGTTVIVVYDSQNIPHNIGFTRPSEIDIYIDLDVTVDPVLYPTDGDTQIEAAIVALGDTSQIGADVIALVYRAIVLSITGVIDVPVFKIDVIPVPLNTGNIEIAADELAVFDSSRIEVHSS